MLDTPTRKRIDDCRDILVGKLPDPKAQIEQITIGLIYKFMNDMDKEAIELGGKAKFFANYMVSNPEFPADRTKDILVPFEQYSWSNLFNAKVTANDMLRLYSEAIAGMDKNPNIPPLFRDIFKNAFLPYRDPETLKLFLKTIGEFEYTHSEKLGDAFEYLLLVMGSQGDAGQFRTPRHIIDFVVKVVNPTKKDKILDPACGTAGFLISAFKHIKETNEKGLTPDDRRRLMQNFAGYDISPDMVRLSLVNLYLHGFSDPHIWEYDTLSSEDRWDESYDVILANPPFMSPKGGIRPHKKFSISSNRSEVLFVDYIAEHLNSKGRAGIIVPEGVIFQSGTAYKEVRKMLVENYLYAVVSLPAGVFNPYSGVKTSVLVMDKEFAKQSSEILFVKIDNDGFGLGAQRNAIKGGQLEEAVEVLHQFRDGELFESKMAHAVNKTAIENNGDYNLSGERYKVQSILNTSFNLVRIDELFELIKNGRNVTQFDEKGKYRVTRIQTIADKSVNLENTKWTNDEIPEDYFMDEGDILLSHINSFEHLAKSAIFTGIKEQVVHGINLLRFKPDKSKVIPEYVYEVFRSDFFINKAKLFAQKAVNQASLRVADLKSIEIPLPPLSIQEEIVAEIEGYQKIINGAKAVVENYKPKIDIEPDWEMVELGEVAKPEYGFTEKAQDEGSARFIRITDIGTDGKLIKTDAKFIQLNKEAEKSIVRRDDILLARTGATYGKTMIYEEDYPAVFASFLIRLNFDRTRVFPKFYWAFAQSENYISQAASLMTGGGQPQFNGNVVVKIKLPLPSLETQQQIVAQIEKEQALVNANKELIQIFEQKIKDRIAKVWGAEREPKTYEVKEEVLSAVAEA